VLIPGTQHAFREKLFSCELVHKLCRKSREISPRRQLYLPILLGFSLEIDLISSLDAVSEVRGPVRALVQADGSLAPALSLIFKENAGTMPVWQKTGGGQGRLTEQVMEVSQAR